MNDKEFENWFYDNVDEMIENGIMHPKSQAAKWVKLALSASLSHYESALLELENRIRVLEGQPPKVIESKPKPKVVEKPKTQPKVAVVEPKPKKVVSKQQWL